MHLFISYARVDKPYCRQIVDLLDMHDVWYDQRLHIGQKWWDEIMRRLHWCEGFIYLLSPDSVASEYCRRELDIALKLQKAIFPVIIQRGTEVPASLSAIQYADLTNGLDVTAVKTLLSAIFIAEREVAATPEPSETAVLLPLPEPAKPEGSVLFDEAVHAFERSDYDKAVFLLKQVKESGYLSRFIDLRMMMRQAETALVRASYEREAQREYAPIAVLIKNENTRAMGCTAFQAFQATFPDYDPDNLREIFEQTIIAQPLFDPQKALPLLEWCQIPAGKTTITRNRLRKVFEVGACVMSKYPITNAQYQAFIDAPDGYKNPAWWHSWLEVRRWRAEHLKPIEMPPNRENHPRANICWYEAAAFCQWLSYKTGWLVKLPTEQQWQRAAQGDTNWQYPWGSRLDPNLCNTKETGLRGTTPVTQYPRGASPYGVSDMLGNVWEWCMNGQAAGETGDLTVDILRIVRGSSFMTARNRTNINLYYPLNPLYRYQSIGFRVVCETGAEFLAI